MRVTFALILTFIATFGGPVLASQNEKINKLKAQIIKIQNVGKLGVRNLTMCRKVLGYGVYVPYSANVALKGAVIFFYYEIENIFTNKSKDKY